MRLLLFFIGCCFASKVLHISDIHYDAYYEAGKPTQCLQDKLFGTGCCRKSSVKIDNASEASKWGDLNCDLPFSAVNATLQWIKENHDDISYLFFTGDIVDHHDISQSIEGNIGEMDEIFKVFTHYFPKIPFYFVLGNHDTYPIDQTLPYVYKQMLEKISPYLLKWLPKESWDRFQQYGYYSVSLGNYVQLIGINSNYYDSDNLLKITSDEKDEASGYQMEWLEKQFTLSEKTNKKVILMGHIPLFGSESSFYYNQRLGEILLRYSKIVLIHLNGHEHSDHFYLYQINNTILSYATIPNSLMASHNFPGFRIMEYDSSSNMFVNYQQYICNLTEIIKKNKYSCTKLYDFQELYKVKNMSTTSFSSIYHNMSTNRTLLNIYLKYKDYGNPNAEQCHTEACTIVQLGKILYRIDEHQQSNPSNK